MVIHNRWCYAAGAENHHNGENRLESHIVNIVGELSSWSRGAKDGVGRTPPYYCVQFATRLGVRDRGNIAAFGVIRRPALLIVDDDLQRRIQADRLCP